MAYENIGKFIQKFSLSKDYEGLKFLLEDAAEALDQNRKEDAVGYCKEFIDKFTLLAMGKLKEVLQNILDQENNGVDQKVVRNVSNLTNILSAEKLFNKLEGKDEDWFVAMNLAATKKDRQLVEDLNDCYQAVQDLRKLKKAMDEPEPKYTFKITQLAHRMVATTHASTIRALNYMMTNYTRDESAQFSTPLPPPRQKKP